MNTKTLAALLKLSGTLKCSCGAPYKLFSIKDNVKNYYFLKVIHNPDNLSIYSSIYYAIILYDLKNNKLLTDGLSQGYSDIPSDVKSLLGDKINLLGIIE